MRVHTPWVRWLYRLVLALMVAGLAVAWFVPAEESASGPALVDAEERTFVALLPAIVSSDLQPGRHLSLEVDGLSEDPGVHGRALRAEPADPADIRRVGFGSFPQPAILVTGLLVAEGSDAVRLPSSRRVTGRAVVVLRREPLLTVFLHGLQGVF